MALIIPKNKKYRVLLILAIILCVIVCTITFIIYNKNFLHTTENTGQESEETLEEVNNEENNEIITITSDTVSDEDCIYYNTSKRYIGNTYDDNDKVRVLLENSEEHFIFQFQSDNETLDDWDRIFILVNLENQYCRYKKLLNHDLTEKITVTLHYSQSNSLGDLSYEGSWSGLTWIHSIDIYHELTSYTDYSEENYKRLANVISHELVHIFQTDVKTVSFYGWYTEAMAVTYAEPISWQYWTEELQDLENIPEYIKEDIRIKFQSLNDLNTVIIDINSDDRNKAYDTCHLFLLYLNNFYGEEKMLQFYEVGIPQIQEEDTVSKSFEAFFRVKVEELYEEWITNL